MIFGRFHSGTPEPSKSVNYCLQFRPFGMSFRAPSPFSPKFEHVVRGTIGGLYVCFHLQITTYAPYTNVFSPPERTGLMCVFGPSNGLGCSFPLAYGPFTTQKSPRMILGRFDYGTPEPSKSVNYSLQFRPFGMPFRAPSPFSPKFDHVVPGAIGGLYVCFHLQIIKCAPNTNVFSPPERTGCRCIFGPSNGLGCSFQLAYGLFMTQQTPHMIFGHFDSGTPEPSKSVNYSLQFRPFGVAFRAPSPFSPKFGRVVPGTIGGLHVCFHLQIIKYAPIGPMQALCPWCLCMACAQALHCAHGAHGAGALCPCLACLVPMVPMPCAFGALCPSLACLVPMVCLCLACLLPLGPMPCSHVVLHALCPCIVPMPCMPCAHGMGPCALCP